MVLSGLGAKQAMDVCARDRCKLVVVACVLEIEASYSSSRSPRGGPWMPREALIDMSLRIRSSRNRSALV